MKSVSLDSQVSLFQMLGNTARLKVLLELDGHQTVAEVSSNVNIDRSLASIILCRLRASGVVAYRKAGKEKHYYITDKTTKRMIETVREALSLRHAGQEIA